MVLDADSDATVVIDILKISCAIKKSLRYLLSFDFQRTRTSKLACCL